MEQAFNDESRSRNNETDGLNYDFLNGRPLRLQYQVEPYFQQERQNAELGLFLQDAWTIKRFTLNLGIRMDYVSMGFPAADARRRACSCPRGRSQELKGVPEWTDINPRFGVAIDVFGNGRTAVKASFGRFNQLTRSDLTRRFHPFTASGSTAFRNWNDAQRQLHPRLRAGQLRGQRRVRGHLRRELRQVHSECDGLRRLGHQGQPRLPVGHQRRGGASESATACR